MLPSRPPEPPWHRADPSPGGSGAARASFEASIASLAGLGLPLEEELTRLVDGRFLRRHGHRRAAVRQLYAARSLFTGLGARPHCDTELGDGAPGDRSAAAPARPSPPLTARQLAVAREVAAGKAAASSQAIVQRAWRHRAGSGFGPGAKSRDPAGGGAGPAREETLTQLCACRAGPVTPRARTGAASGQVAAARPWGRSHLRDRSPDRGLLGRSRHRCLVAQVTPGPTAIANPPGGSPNPQSPPPAIRAARRSVWPSRLRVASWLRVCRRKLAGSAAWRAASRLCRMPRRMLSRPSAPAEVPAISGWPVKAAARLGLCRRAGRS